MTVSTEHPERAPRVGGRLDRILGRWADAHRLTARQTETMRERIVSEPATSDFDWWWRLLDPDGGAAFRGLGTVGAWDTADAAFAASLAPTTSWLAAMPVVPGWDHELLDVQPYLRLT